MWRVDTMTAKWIACVGLLGFLAVPAVAGDRPGKGEASRPTVLLKTEVEIRGVLSATETGVTVTVREESVKDTIWTTGEEAVWQLDLGGVGELQKKVRALNGKQVVVTGTARLLGVRTVTYKTLQQPAYESLQPSRPQLGSQSVLVVEHKIKVGTLQAAGK
jgi:hypothetical protein